MDEEAVRRISRNGLARLFRIITGLQKKQCPTNQYGNCYWCEAQIIFSTKKSQTYVGDVPGTHYPNCPWIEVIDYASLRAYEERLDEEPAGADGDDPGGRPVRLPDQEKGRPDA